ncbi:MAG: translation elongation factor Ts [Actinomycetota bacterium]
MTDYQATAAEVKTLRDATGAGMMDAKRALQDAAGDLRRATELLRERGLASVGKRRDRAANEGLVQSYIHFNNRVGVLIEINCETDFVANTDEFKALAKDVALHIASARPRWITTEEVPEDILAGERKVYEEWARQQGKPEQALTKIVEGKLTAFYKDNVLLEQPFVKDDSKSIGQLTDEISAKVGEKIAVRRFARFELGEELG